MPITRLAVTVWVLSAAFARTAGAQQTAPDTVSDPASLVDMKPGAFLQLRSTANKRDPPADENEWVRGFEITRVRLSLRANIEGWGSLFVRAGSDVGGSFRVERAYADLFFGNTTLRLGQFYLPGDAELTPSPDDILGTDYSPTGYTFDYGASQGGMVIYQPGSWRLSAALSAGIRAGFSQSGDERRADLAVTGYAERLLLGDRWTEFDVGHSKPGAAPAVKVGLSSGYQTGGRSGNTDSLDLLYMSADIQAAGSGWKTLGQFLYSRSELGEGFGIETGQTFHDKGFLVQGGVLVTRRLELFARYDQVIPDGKEREPGLRGGTGTNPFRTVTGGLNFFVFPGSSLGKLTVDWQYSFDAQTTSIVPATFKGGVLRSTGPQWTLRAQWVASL